MHEHCRPGPDLRGVPATVALGVVGTLVSGFIGRALFGADGRWGSWLLGLVVTVGLSWWSAGCRPPGGPVLLPTRAGECPAHAGHRPEDGLGRRRAKKKPLTREGYPAAGV
jgi:hypothetical protein